MREYKGTRPSNFVASIHFRRLSAMHVLPLRCSTICHGLEGKAQSPDLRPKGFRA